ncbi:MAG: sigma 54-interacting transcriptional regulator [Sphaerochaetaceae bacterium]|nr:sigma 54-interacting transcriptional regulator [Sphaerochaetaceae bacterium]
MSAEQTRYAQVPLGESEVFLNFQQTLSRAAKVNRSVLVVGERGSGKELAAIRLHYLSPRWQHALVTVNCAALPPSLIETELFGYEAGAFTGATKTRKGRFEEAEGGTLFLDEIGLIPLEVQEKILRVVEYGTFERVGSSKTHESDVRIVGATNTNLLTLCAEGKFKEDLLDRLSFEVLFLPPLRARGDDIILLAEFFAAKMALECGSNDLPILSPTLKEELKAYPWPGNVRELKNVIERAVYRSASREITEVTFNPFENPFEAIDDSVELSPAHHDVPLKRYAETKQELDLSFLRRALEETGGVQKEAAKLLGLTYDQFRGLYRKYKEVLEK